MRFWWRSVWFLCIVLSPRLLILTIEGVSQISWNILGFRGYRDLSHEKCIQDFLVVWNRNVLSHFGAPSYITFGFMAILLWELLDVLTEKNYLTRIDENFFVPITIVTPLDLSILIVSLLFNFPWTILIYLQEFPQRGQPILISDFNFWYIYYHYKNKL